MSLLKNTSSGTKTAYIKHQEAQMKQEVVEAKRLVKLLDAEKNIYINAEFEYNPSAAEVICSYWMFEDPSSYWYEDYDLKNLSFKEFSALVIAATVAIRNHIERYGNKLELEYIAGEDKNETDV
jgi:hypothetical protein